MSLQGGFADQVASIKVATLNTLSQNGGRGRLPLTKSWGRGMGQGSRGAGSREQGAEGQRGNFSTSECSSPLPIAHPYVKSHYLQAWD